MAARKLRHRIKATPAQATPLNEGSSKARVREADVEVDQPVASPVLALQDGLSEAAVAEFFREEDVERLPPAATLAFAIVTCGAFWLAAGFVLSKAMQLR
jgi:hypothetical protein